MSEVNDFKTFKRNVKQPRDRIDRIENVIDSGTPDVNYCIDGVEGWVEIKSPKEPVRATTSLFGSNHKLSVEQRNWFLTQRRAGGVGWVLIATDNRWILIDGGKADVINEMTVAGLCQISPWVINKPIKGKEIWNRLRRILSTKQSHSDIKPLA